MFIILSMILSKHDVREIGRYDSGSADGLPGFRIGMIEAWSLGGGASDFYFHTVMIPNHA